MSDIFSEFQYLDIVRNVTQADPLKAEFQAGSKMMNKIHVICHGERFGGYD